MDDHTPTTELAPPKPAIRTRPRADARLSRPENRRASHAKLVLVLLVLFAVAGGATHWYLTKDEASTDDAYTDGHAIAVASQVSGTVVALRVTDNQRVKTGDVLLEIDPRSYVAARDEAQGSLDVAEAQLANARISLDWTKQDYPARLAAAQASLASAEATHFKAEADQRRQRNLPKQASVGQVTTQARQSMQSPRAAPWRGLPRGSPRLWS